MVPSLEITGGSGSRQVALLRSPGQPQLQLFQSPISQDLDLGTIPESLREQVRASAGFLTYTPVSFVRDGVEVAGITVGAPLTIPLAGSFELFLVFDLSAEQQSLALVQNAITVAGIILLALIALVSYLVTRSVVRPVEQAAKAAVNAKIQRLRLIMKNSKLKIIGKDPRRVHECHHFVRTVWL